MALVRLEMMYLRPPPRMLFCCLSWSVFQILLQKGLVKKLKEGIHAQQIWKYVSVPSTFMAWVSVTFWEHSSLTF